MYKIIDMSCDFQKVELGGLDMKIVKTSKFFNIDLYMGSPIHVSSEANLKENWKIIESLYGVSYQPAVK